MEAVFIYGASGHAAILIDAIELAGNFIIEGIVDDFNTHETSFCGYPILGGRDSLVDLAKSASQVNVVIAVGANYAREKLTAELASLSNKFVFVSVFHPRAIVSQKAKLATGIQVLAGAVIGPEAQLGDGVLVNHNATVDHGVVLSAFSSLAPGANVAGNVVIGQRTSVGIGASVIEKLTLGNDSVIGAGAVVINNISNAVVAVGVPARELRPRDVCEPYLN